jgi:hypothetical protein
MSVSLHVTRNCLKFNLIQSLPNAFSAISPSELGLLSRSSEYVTKFDYWLQQKGHLNHS